MGDVVILRGIVSGLLIFELPWQRQARAGVRCWAQLMKHLQLEAAGGIAISVDKARAMVYRQAPGHVDDAAAELDMTRQDKIVDKSRKVCDPLVQ